MARKRRRLPEVLHRAYGHRARALSDTILSLLSPPPSASEDECRTCGGRGCLGCGGASHLIRTGDNSEYVRLMTRGVAVVSEGAPPPPAFRFRNHRAQRLIVRNVMEVMVGKSRHPANVLCNGYRKQQSCFSPNGEFLCTAAWELLLNRIGDEMMAFLLNFTSIFVPLSIKNHHQVTGPSLNGIFQTPNYRSCGTVMSHSASKPQLPLPLPVRGYPCNGCQRKRRRVELERKTELGIASNQNRISLVINSSVSSVMSDAAKARKHIGFIQDIHLHEATAAFSRNRVDDHLSLGFDSSTGHAIDQGGKFRKHGRPFSWQRRRKRRLMNLSHNPPNSHTITEEGKIEEVEQFLNTNEHHHPAEHLEQYNCDAYKEACDMTDQNNASMALQNVEARTWISEENMNKETQCFCSLLLNAPQKVAMGSQIKRKHMLYSSCSYNSIFPKSHILSRLKPNYSGALLLMKHIFGVPSVPLNAQFNGSDCCTIKSDCLCCSFLSLLRKLILNTRRCQYLKLLNKHCSTSAVGQNNLHGSKSSPERMKYHYLVNVSTRRPMGLQNSLMKSFIEHWQKEILKKTSKFGQFELYRAYCSHKQLVSYVWAVCRSIVPVDFLGGTSNWRTFRKNISKFVQLRRFENFSLKQCTYGLKSSRFSFLSKISQSSCFCNHGIEDDFGEGASKKSAISDAIIILKDRLFLSWIHWFYSYLVVPLLGAHFYVTESEVGKQEISHYKKPLWRKVVNRAIVCLRKLNYQILDHTSVQSILNKRPFGFSKVRFLPKEKGVRPLANLKAQSRARFPVHSISLNACNGQTGKRAEKFCTLQYAYKKPRLVHFRSVNYALHDLYVILKKIMGEQPEKLGSSVFDYNDAYKLLHPFITSLRIGSMVMPKVYIVVCDVSKAFDTIDQDKLLRVMRDIMHDDNYLLKKYAKVFCSKKSIRILYDQVPFDQNSSTDMIKATSSLQFHAPNGVLIDQGTSKRIKGKVFDTLLSEHVKQNVVQLGTDFYLQKVGIAQGSLISSFLCSFYYGHLERSIIFPFIEKTEEHVQFESYGVEGNQYVENPRDCADEQGGVILKKKEMVCSQGNQYKDNGSVMMSNDGLKNASLFPKYVLLRLIDDFLFISTSKKQATSFLARMRRGFREYNCYMNEGKFGMNFDIESQSGSLSNRVHISEDGTLFLSWSGLLINCCTMEIQADYTRYLGISISSTLTVPAQSKSCYHLKKKLCDYMRPKCHPIFYDSNINSPAVVRLNAYQSFLLCAMKFHCYFCAMPDTSGISSTQYYLEIIQRSFRYMYKLIKKRMYSMKVGSNIHPILRLKREEVEWLGLSAYIRVLRRKQSRHAKLLLLLRFKSETYGREIHDSSHTRYAIDDSHSSMFWKMKY